MKLMKRKSGQIDKLSKGTLELMSRRRMPLILVTATGKIDDFA